MEFFPRIVPLRETRRGFWMTMTFKDKNKLLVSIFCFTAARVCNMNMLLPFVFLQRDHVYTLGRWDWACSRWRKNY